MLLCFGTARANPDPQSWGGLQGMGQDPCVCTILGNSCSILGNSCPALVISCLGFAARRGAGGHQELLPVLPAAPSWSCEWGSWQHQAPSCSASALRFASQGGSRALWGYWRRFGSFRGLTRCCPSAACSRSVARSLQAGLSLPRVVSLTPARGRGLLSLLSPRGVTHTPGGQSRSTRLLQLAGRALSHPQPCSSQLCRRLGDARGHPRCCRGVSSVTGSKRGERGASPCSEGRSSPCLPTAWPASACGSGYSCALHVPAACLLSSPLRDGKSSRAGSCGAGDKQQHWQGSAWK